MDYAIPDEELMFSGHLACPGCGGALAMRLALKALGEKTIVVIPACCWSIIAGPFPYSSLKVPLMHTAFETGGSVAAGIKAGLEMRGDTETTVLTWAGDGGTFDIGLQALSGAVERNEDFIYACYDNEAYMNTGIQRSSATTMGAHTTTSPAGSVIPGKVQWAKPLTEIMAAHHIPYAAQANPWRWQDLMEKARKAVAADGPAFLNVISPCPRGWRHEPSETIEIARLATETCIWPLFEVENGVWKLNYKPREKKPVEEWFRAQGRFRHLFTPAFEHVIAEVQERVDREWERLLRLCGEA